MDVKLQALFFGVAVLLFVIDAFSLMTTRVKLASLGLAVFVFVFFWNAVEAGW